MRNTKIKNLYGAALLIAAVVFTAACSGPDPEQGSATTGPEPAEVTRQAAPTEETGVSLGVAGGETTAGNAETAPAGPVEVETQVLVTGLEAPWGLAFLPDGRALVTERDTNRLLAVDESGEIEEVQRVPASGSGEGGLLGVALSPDYEEDGYVYAYYSTGEDNRIARFRLGAEPEVILSGIPVNVYHDGGRISFGPDGMLYVATGDAGDPWSSQDPDSLAGKILRLTPEGQVPEDNPFTDNPTYSLGHRNVQGLAWDEQGRLFASEFGQNAYDEVNRIEAGGNYGWPEVEGEGGEPEYIDPVATFSTSEASPSGAEIPRNGAIPQWEGDFLMAALRGEALWRLDLSPDGTVTGRERLLSNEFGRLRHVAQAPDGSLWVLTNNRDGRGDPTPEDDRILRLSPVGG